MASEAPEEVYPYLILHNDYRLDFTLDVCKQHEIFDATAYILERCGSFPLLLLMVVLMAIVFVH